MSHGVVDAAMWTDLADYLEAEQHLIDAERTSGTALRELEHLIEIGEHNRAMRICKDVLERLAWLNRS